MDHCQAPGQWSTEPNLQVVDRDMRRRRGDGGRQRLAPCAAREVRQAGDEVQAPASGRRCAHRIEGREGVLEAVRAAARLQQGLLKSLRMARTSANDQRHGRSRNVGVCEQPASRSLRRQALKQADWLGRTPKLACTPTLKRLIPKDMYSRSRAASKVPARRRTVGPSEDCNSNRMPA